jgi:hypothetical protein
MYECGVPPISYNFSCPLNFERTAYGCCLSIVVILSRSPKKR